MTTTTENKKATGLYKINADKRTLVAMAIIPFLCLIVFAYGPIFGWVYAFFDYRIGMKLANADFVGFKFFKIAFHDRDLIRVIINTLAMSGLSLLVIPVAAVFAIFLAELRFTFLKKLVQTLTTFPNFISWVIVYSIFYTLFATDDGFINKLLLDAHWITTSINPLGDGEHVWLIQTLIRMWKDTGFMAIIFFAAISGIPGELYDAAKVDGAGRLDVIRHITIPGILSTVITLLIISIGAILSSGFDQFYVFYNPLVANQIEVLDYYVYKIGLQTNDIPYATAMSVAKTFISIILVFSANWLTKVLRGQSIL